MILLDCSTSYILVYKRIKINDIKRRKEIQSNKKIHILFIFIRHIALCDKVYFNATDIQRRI